MLTVASAKEESVQACVGGSICEHLRQRSKFEAFGSSSIFEHHLRGPAREEHVLRQAVAAVARV